MSDEPDLTGAERARVAEVLRILKDTPPKSRELVLVYVCRVYIQTGGTLEDTDL